jgi:RND family efflux transporter MFP subunit
MVLIYTKHIKSLLICASLLFNNLSYATSKVSINSLTTHNKLVKNYLLSSQVEPFYRQTLVARTDGVIDVIPAIGAEFMQGQEIVKMDLSLKNYELKMAKSQQALHKFQLNQLQSQAARREKLKLKNILDDESYEYFLVKLHQSETEQVLASQQLASIQWYLDNSVFKIEFSGVVTNRHVAPGSYVKSGQPLLDIISTHYKKGVFDLPRELAMVDKSNIKLTIGQGDKTMSISDFTIYPVFEHGLVNFKLVINLRDVPNRLGQKIDLQVMVEEPYPDIYSIEQSSINYTFEGHYIYVVDEQFKAKKIKIDIVERFKQYAFVKGNLKAGDRVIVSGHKYLAEGAEVQF